MKKLNIKNILTILILCAMFVIGIVWLNNNQKLQFLSLKSSEKTINGMLMLIEFEEIDGVLQWEKELDKRNLTAMVKVQNNVLEEYPEVFKRLANKGYEIAGGYDKAPFWDMPYEEQYQYLKEAQELVEKITDKSMRVFGSRYFAYDENTLKAADALDIEYILARGTQDVSAVIYDPEEYDSNVISVTNVENGEMGRGSLCDYSLWARGADATEFAQILEESLAKKPENMILVSHAYLGGTRQEWWNEYKKVLETDRVTWVGFDEWLNKQNFLVAPNSEIPVNREVKYVQPQPAKSMEEYTSVSDLEIIDLVMFHNGQGEMCLEAIEFFKEYDIEYKEYLNTEIEFRNLLNQYQIEHPVSVGESESYQYLPIIFYKGKAYSGFNNQVAARILKDWQE